MVMFCVFDLSRSARSGLVMSFVTQFTMLPLHSTRSKLYIDWLMARGEFASGEVLPSEKVTIHFYSWKIVLQNP